MRQVRDRIETSDGYEVVARWIDQEDQDEGLGADVLTENPHLGTPYAQKDMEDIDKAGIVVLFTSGNGGGRGGYHTELGLALARDIPIMIVGPRENVFHTLSQITRVSTIDELMTVLSSRLGS